MTTAKITLSAAWPLLWLAPALLGAPIQHDFLVVDEGLSNLRHVDQADPRRNWQVHLGLQQPRDMQLEGGNRLLLSHDHGYAEYDLTTGARVKEVSTFHDVSAARRLENGDLLLAGVDFDQPKAHPGDGPLGDPDGRHILFVEYDPMGRVVRRTRYVGDFIRLVRQTAAGTYLCGTNGMLKEADGAGHWIGALPETGFQHAWMALRLPNGHTLMSAGTATPVPPRRFASSFLVELDAEGRHVRTFGAAGQVPARVRPNFYAMFQVLPDGHVVVANWQGHGPGHNHAGPQVLEFDPSGAIAWEWSDPTSVSSVQGVLILDGLDPSRLNDERSGTMGPVPAAAGGAR